MAMLDVLLHDGFDGEAVTVRIDGQVAFEQENMVTSPLIGTAGGFQREIPDGPVEVEVTLPQRGIHRTATFVAKGVNRVVISIEAPPGVTPLAQHLRIDHGDGYAWAG